MRKLLPLAGRALFWLVVAACLLATIAPHFLDRRYYRGPVTGHYDGRRFRNPDGDAPDAPGGGGGRAGFFWRRLTGGDGRPAWPDRVPVRPSRPERRVAGGRMVATWVGHATVLVQAAGLNILTDPVWSDRTGPFGLGPRRAAAPGVRFDDLPPIDLVLVSHNHYDHMDLATLKRLWDRDRPVFVTGLGNDSLLRSAGVGTGAAGRVRALDWGGCAEAPAGSRACVVRAHHWSSRWLRDRNRALWSGFVVTFPSGGNLYFAGDTGAGDFAWADEAAAYGPIRLALIPIGAFRFRPGQMASGEHMGPADAAEAFRRLGAARAIPVHWGTFRLSYEGYDTPPRLLAAAMRCAGRSGFAAVAVGRPVEAPPYSPPAPSPPVPRAAMAACLDTPAVRSLR